MEAMEKRLIELSLQRGRLQERAAAQRAALAASLQPVLAAVDTADRGLVKARQGVQYLKRHPMGVGLAVAALAAIRPQRAWRWGRRAFVAWSVWRKIRPRLVEAGLLTPRSAA